MTDARASFIVNPVAGGGRMDPDALIADVLAARPGAEIQFAVTERAGHATFLAHELASAGYDPIVAVGGDGTVHEVANGLLEYGGSIPTLGVVPIGTGNDFARSVGIPTRFPDAIAVAVGDSGTARTIDVARCNGRYFIGVAGAGLDARVASAVNAAPRRMKIGALPFVWYALREIASKRSVELVVKLDRDTVLRQESLLVSVSNCRFSGGGMQFAPEAQPDDGQLDVCIVGDASRRDLLRLLPRVFSGGHVGHPMVALHRAARVTISGPPQVRAQADGELIGGLPLEISVVPGALRVLVAT